MAIGTIIGILAGVSPLIMISPLMLYGLDTGWTMLNRLRLGWTHTRTTLFFAALASMSSGASLMWFSTSALFRGAGVVVIAADATTYVLSSSQ